MLIDLNNYTNFGNLLQKLRANKQISLRGAATEIGISAVYLSDLENGGRKPPKGRILNNIFNYYEISEEEQEYIKEQIQVERLGTTKEQLEFLSKNQYARKVVDMLMQIEDFDEFIKENPYALEEIQSTINYLKENKTNTK